MSRPTDLSDPRDPRDHAPAPRVGAPGTSGAAAGERLREVPLFVWLVLAGLCATVFSGHWQEMGLPIGPDRALLPLGIVLLLLDPRAGLPGPRAVHVLMASLVGWTALSAVVHGMLAADPLFALVDRVALPFVLFAIAPAVLSTSRRRDLLLQMLTLLGAYLAVTTLLEGLGMARLTLPGYIAAGAGLGSDEVARAGGPFVSGEANGMSLAMCAFAAALLAARVRDLWRVLACCVAPACLLGTVLTMTRSVWLGVTVGVIAAAWMARPTRRLLPAILACVVAVLAIGALAFPQIAQDAATRGATSRSVYDRENVNNAALRILHDEPLTGIGWQRVVHEGGDWVRQADDIPVTSVNIEVHNVILSRAAELGIPAALVLLVVIVLGPLRAAGARQATDELRAWRQAYVGILCVWLVPLLTSPVPYPFPNFLLWLIAGLLCVTGATPDRLEPATGEAHAPEGLRPQSA